MNKNQEACMWVGILLIAAVGLCFFVQIFPTDMRDDISRVVATCCRFGLWVFIVALVTGGFIYTLRDKQSKKDKGS